VKLSFDFFGFLLEFSIYSPELFKVLNGEFICGESPNAVNNSPLNLFDFSALSVCNLAGLILSTCINLLSRPPDNFIDCSDL